MFSDPFSLASILGGSSYPGMTGQNLPTLPGLGGIGAPAASPGFDLASEWEKFFNTARQEPSIGDKLLMLGTALSTGNGLHEGLANAASAFMQRKQSEKALETQLSLERMKQLQAEKENKDRMELENKKYKLTEKEVDANIGFKKEDQKFNREKFDFESKISEMTAKAQIAQANSAAGLNNLNYRKAYAELTDANTERENRKMGLLPTATGNPAQDALAASANVKILEQMKAQGLTVATPEMIAEGLRTVQTSLASAAPKMDWMNDPNIMVRLAGLEGKTNPLTMQTEQNPLATMAQQYLQSQLDGSNITAAPGSVNLRAGEKVLDTESKKIHTIVSFDGRTLVVSDDTGKLLKTQDPALIKQAFDNKVK